MPKNNDIQKVLLIGSGPIVIGQAAEFDYSGTQACQALKEDGKEVILVNSNPATIMTDNAMADKIYIEPLTVTTLKRIIEKERPSGPIVIGQAAEFDYSGTQACQALKEDGKEVILVNSNPATIMTDNAMADKIYIEPLTVTTLKRIIEKERPDSILSTLGGQTALTLSMQLAKEGYLEKMGVKLLGADPETIDKAEDRQMFKDTMLEIGQPVIPSEIVEDLDSAVEFAGKIGYPVIVRPAFTLGGSGGGIANDEEEFKKIAENGLRLSPITQILVEKCISGWKEIEFEVVRDGAGNAITVCSMENFDPVGVHTGDSIVIAPAVTLADKEYQMLRTAAIKIVDAMGVEGGCNCQFALNPNSDEYAVIEVNPRVSRSSALASKATGYPIAKVAAKIALGYRLDEIKNEITKQTYACFEPALDYVVVKFPKWPFDKFVYAKRELGTQMKATGEVMAIGQNFETALMKAVRGSENKTDKWPFDKFVYAKRELGTQMKATGEVMAIGQNFETALMKAVRGSENKTDCCTLPKVAAYSDEQVKEALHVCNDERVFVIYEALKRGISCEEIHEITKVDNWFLYKMKNIAEVEKELSKGNVSEATYNVAKRYGFLNSTIERISGEKVNYSAPASFKMVDTCAGEFKAETPYFYSCCDEVNEADEFIERKGIRERKTVVVLGSGPIRIGQGIEFDYSAVHCVWALKKAGFDVVIINNNPETVSTDFDTADRLYFEPLTPEDVMNVMNTEKPYGVVVAFGGQTAINLTKFLESQGINVLGSSAESIDMAEDRERFDELLESLHIKRPQGHTVLTEDEALKAANELGYPVLMRPSYVLGGQNMIIAFGDEDIKEYMKIILKSNKKDNPILIDKYMMGLMRPSYVLGGQNMIIAFGDEDIKEYMKIILKSNKKDNPILIDKYMMGVEVEVDAICDGEDILIPGIMEHIERAGVHSGDSIAVCPSWNISEKLKEKIVEYSKQLAVSLKTKGLVNIQYVIYEGKIYVIEVNPRSSRTIPYLSKITGVPMVELAVRAMIFSYNTLPK